MTRGKDIFWAVLVAGLPLVGTLGFGFLEKYFNDIIQRTFEIVPYFVMTFLIFCLLGLLLAMVAVRFCSGPRETSRLPLIGLMVGWAISIVITICFFLPFLAESAGGLTKYLWVYGSRRDVLFLGFYTVLLFWYRKHHTLVTAEDLKKEIEEA